MATFTRTQIPDSIVTVEALAVWVMEILCFMNPSATITVAAGEADKVFDSTKGRNFPLQTSNPNRYVFGGYIPLNLDSGVAPIWQGTAEVATGAIPTQFRKAGT